MVRCREDIIDWLIKTHDSLKLRRKTLFSAVAFLDCFLEKKEKVPVTDRSEDHVEEVKDALLKIAASCLYLAAKFEESNTSPLYIVEVMPLSTTRHITQISMCRAIVAQSEELCDVLDYNLSPPTTFSFIMGYLTVIGHAETTAMVEYCCYLAELALYSADLVAVSPSKLATAIVIATGRKMNEPNEFPDALEELSEHTFDEVAPLAQEMVELSQSVVSNVTPDGAIKRFAVKKYQDASRVLMRREFLVDCQKESQR